MLRAFHVLILTLLACCLASTAASAGPSDFDRANLFRSSCAPCHGATGMGGGSVAAALKDPVPVLATLTQRFGGAFPEDYVHQVIDGRTQMRAHGTRLMPVWGDDFLRQHDGEGGESSTDFMIDALVQHIKSLQLQ